jgi:hypothetical protein
MSNTYTCRVHNRVYDEGIACAECMDFLATAPKHDEMTADERVAEVNQWYDNVLTVNGDDFHGRLTELAGVPVWSHELADRDMMARLAGQDVPSRPHPLDTLAAMADGKPIIVVEHS